MPHICALGPSPFPSPYSRPSLTFPPQDGKTRCTTGSVVSSLYHLKDSENENRDAGFFVFPDLSVRQEGSYRLKLSLFEVVGCVPTHNLSSSLSLLFTFISPPLPKCDYTLCLVSHSSQVSYLRPRQAPFLFAFRDSYPFRSVQLGVLFHFVVSCGFYSMFRPTP